MPKRADRLHTLGPMLAAAALSLALYAITLGGTYIYDDRSVVQDDTRIQSPRQWGKLWTESYNGGVDNLYRPLDSQIFALQWWLHGDRPWAFHLVNILLNAAAAAAVAELARRLVSANPGRSRDEIAELLDIARQALADVRTAVKDDPQDKIAMGMLMSFAAKMEQGGAHIVDAKHPAPARPGGWKSATSRRYRWT